MHFSRSIVGRLSFVPEGIGLALRGDALDRQREVCKANIVIAAEIRTTVSWGTLRILYLERMKGFAARAKARNKKNKSWKNESITNTCIFIFFSLHAQGFVLEEGQGRRV
ncbi:hypothetical protein ABW19_dt0202038 [Dactylella cylindrospora]|nr:hypothetical protein ABW19_dt0202038 [Dactylella cylindrospora]